jgi:hypothetical protein
MRSQEHHEIYSRSKSTEGLRHLGIMQSFKRLVHEKMQANSGDLFP